MQNICVTCVGQGQRAEQGDYRSRTTVFYRHVLLLHWIPIQPEEIVFDSR